MQEVESDLQSASSGRQDRSGREILPKALRKAIFASSSFSFEALEALVFVLYPFLTLDLFTWTLWQASFAIAVLVALSCLGSVAASYLFPFVPPGLFLFLLSCSRCGIWTLLTIFHWIFQDKFIPSLVLLCLDAFLHGPHSVAHYAVPSMLLQRSTISAGWKNHALSHILSTTGCMGHLLGSVSVAILYTLFSQMKYIVFLPALSLASLVVIYLIYPFVPSDASLSGKKRRLEILKMQGLHHAHRIVHSHRFSSLGFIGVLFQQFYRVLPFFVISFSIDLLDDARFGPYFVSGLSVGYLIGFILFSTSQPRHPRDLNLGSLLVLSAIFFIILSLVWIPEVTADWNPSTHFAVAMIPFFFFSLFNVQSRQGFYLSLRVFVPNGYHGGTFAFLHSAMNLVSLSMFLFFGVVFFFFRHQSSTTPYIIISCAFGLVGIGEILFASCVNLEYTKDLPFAGTDAPIETATSTDVHEGTDTDDDDDYVEKDDRDVVRDGSAVRSTFYFENSKDQARKDIGLNLSGIAQDEALSHLGHRLAEESTDVFVAPLPGAQIEESPRPLESDS